MDRPIALLARHGDTKYSDEGIIISRTDVMPNSEGTEQMDEQHSFLSKFDISSVFCSPLVRCVIPARKFAGDGQFQQDRGLLPWDRGVLTGVLSEEAKPLMDLLVTNPSVRIPHGESRRDAESRIRSFFLPILDKAERDPVFLFFTHHTVIDLLCGLMCGETDSDPKNIVDVGGVAGIYVDDDGYRMEPLLCASSDSIVQS